MWKRRILWIGAMFRRVCVISVDESTLAGSERDEPSTEGYYVHLSHLYDQYM